MSGRKATEVNGLLERGRDARNAGKANYENKFRLTEQLLKTNEIKLEAMYTKLANTSFVLNAESQTEFPKEAEALKRQYQTILNGAEKISYQAEMMELTGKKEQLETELEKADWEANRIKDRIRNKSHYCDAEYRDADNLLKKYQKIAREKEKLSSSTNALAQNSNQDVIYYENLDLQMKQLLASKNQLEERAKSIIQLREKATEAKSYVQKGFAEIEPDRAKKFLPEPYQELSGEVQRFSELPDGKVVQQVTELTEKISLFANRLQLRYAEFLKAKASAEASLEGNMQLLSTDKNFYFEPIDYFKNKENASKYDLLEYLTEYSDKTEMVSGIRQGIDTMKKMIAEERFEEAERQALENRQNIEQAASYATVLQEHLIENFYVARDIKGVMTKMGFETGAVKLDGNIKNGWRVTAKSPGGESIDFSQVFINDDGEVKIDIDHKTMGSCPSKWENICKALDEAGIYIEKIDMENGTNVLNKREKKQSNVSENKAEQVRAFS